MLYASVITVTVLKITIAFLAFFREYDQILKQM